MKKIIQALRNASFATVLVIFPLSVAQTADALPVDQYESMFLHNALENKVSFYELRKNIYE